MMHVQLMMDMPKPDKPAPYNSFAQMFEDKDCPIENKLKIIGWVYKFETHNGFTKNDLVAMIRWMFDENYVFTTGKKL